MPTQRPLIGKLLLHCAVLFASIIGCTQSSVSPNEAIRAIVPGEDIQIVDAYFNDQNHLANIVFKNTRDYALPSFTLDYSLSCDNGYKIYNSTFFNLSSNEQESTTFVIGSGATSCTWTITAIRPQYRDDYIDWTGSYPIQIQAQETETTDE